MQMIERVARAMCVADGDDPDGSDVNKAMAFMEEFGEAALPYEWRNWLFRKIGG
ncbi:hypothetical protein [Rhizobium sp. 60-20]|uniref:hypothetical protein n=1 Tax=Rhizobium sp. 60-20 TaxID=1895819 RepID=UPI000AEFD255|nr:hypothetical protein [Rhizobium sp. 60-20]